MPWSSVSQDLSPKKHPWEILDLFITAFWKVKQQEEQKATEHLHFCSSISFLLQPSWPGFLPSFHSPLALNRLKMFSQMPGAIRLSPPLLRWLSSFLSSSIFILSNCVCMCAYKWWQRRQKVHYVSCTMQIAAMHTPACRIEDLSGLTCVRMCVEQTVWLIKRKQWSL